MKMKDSIQLCAASDVVAVARSIFRAVTGQRSSMFAVVQDAALGRLHPALDCTSLLHLVAATQV